jgi:hypothetical protein
MNYVTVEDFKQSTELTGTNFADRDIERAIAAASRSIDDICHRSFDQDATLVARYYTARIGTLCEIGDVMAPADDLTEPTLTVVELDLAADGSYSTAWTEGTDYQLEPLNAAADDKPYETLRSLLTTFPSRAGAVRVTARYGWTEIPDQVVEATILLSNKLLVRVRQAPFGIITAGIDSGVAMRIVRSDPDVGMLLDELVRESVF